MGQQVFRKRGAEEQGPSAKGKGVKVAGTWAFQRNEARK